MGRRYYSAKKIGQTRARLIANAGYVKPTAEAEDVSRSTVRKWDAGDYPPHVDPADVEREIEIESKELAEKLSRLATGSLDKAAELVDTLKSARDAAITAAIAIDKMQLLRGRPTDRIETVSLADFLAQAVPDSGTAQPLREPKTEERVAQPYN